MMDPCPGEMVCPPPDIAWSAMVLWTITVYGVLTIVSLFTVVVHWREPTATGSRILRQLSFFDVGAAAAAPLIILLALDAPRAATAAVLGQLALASLCRVAARRTSSAAELPPARVLR